MFINVLHDIMDTSAPPCGSRRSRSRVRVYSSILFGWDYTIRPAPTRLPAARLLCPIRPLGASRRSSPLIDDGSEGEPVIHIDDHALSLQEFSGLLRTYTGWGMRIVFVEDDNAEPPLVEIRDLENGEAAHDWR